MSNSDRWFLEAMQNAVAAGHLTEDGAEHVKTALFECCAECDELVKKGEAHGGGPMNYEKCKDCGDVLGTNSLCSGACKAEAEQRAIDAEPDFERLRELQNDYRSWQRDGDEA